MAKKEYQFTITVTSDSEMTEKERDVIVSHYIRDMVISYNENITKNKMSYLIRHSKK